jgi:hypothetical protein
MEYNFFIQDLKKLLKEAHNLIDAANYDENHSFRKWRFQVTELVDRIKSEGFYIVCDIKSRSFGNINSTVRENQQKQYNMELQDTITEVETIISNHKRYGPPKKITKKQDIKDIKELDWPQKITLYWLFRHAPISLWIKLAGIVLAALTIGITAGQSQLFHEIKEKITQKQENNSTMVVPNIRVHGTADSRRPY